jgi:hypothetical protein
MFHEIGPVRYRHLVDADVLYNRAAELNRLFLLRAAHAQKLRMYENLVNRSQKVRKSVP